MEVVAAADVDHERALEALWASGRDPDEGQKGRVGRPAATHEPMDLVRSGSVDVVVEATGIVEVGARVAHHYGSGRMKELARPTPERIGVSP